MRVALVSLHSSPLELPATQNAGGMNVVVYELAQSLASAGHDVTLVVSRESVARAVLPVPAGVDVLGVATEARASSGSDQYSVRTSELRSILHSHDVVHAHYWLSGELCAQALRDPVEGESTRPPLVVSLHTLGAEKLAFGEHYVSGERMRAEKELAQTVPLIASSHAEAEAIRVHCGAPAAEISVIPPGVNLRTFQPGAAVRANHLLVVGRLQPYKGQDFALDVFARLLEDSVSSPELHDLELSFVGTATPGAEPFAADLRAGAVQLGLTDRVQFVGALPRAELASALARASVTLIPSRSETFGMVALESAAAGTPVMAQRVGGLPESVADGRSGLLLDSRDGTEWARCLFALLTGSHELAALRQSARQFAEAHSWERAAELHLSAYRRAIEAAR